MVTIFYRLTMGSTTQFGNVVNGWRFKLPATGTDQIAANNRGSAVSLTDASSGLVYLATAEIPPNEDTLLVVFRDQYLRSDYPFTWANGDRLEFSFTYMCK
jgi:hypothetical protein